MKNIKVTLLHHTPLHIASDGARTCWSSQDKSDTCKHSNISILDGGYICTDCGTTKDFSIDIGPKDLALTNRVGNELRHASILEHISFNFLIDGISRACLQELARHRIASLSVKSSRYTLKELKSRIHDTTKESLVQWAQQSCVMTNNHAVNTAVGLQLYTLQDILQQGISNDEAKYCLPEAYRTQLTWTINMRSLQNFLSLRTDRTALPEIQHLAHLIYEALPADAQSLVAHCVKGIDDATV